MGEYFFLNGKIIKAQEAYLHITDLALLRGFGIFDFCRTINGIPLLINNYLLHIQCSFTFSNKLHDIYYLINRIKIKSNIGKLATH